MWCLSEVKGIGKRLGEEKKKENRRILLQTANDVQMNMQFDDISFHNERLQWISPGERLGVRRPGRCDEIEREKWTATQPNPSRSVLPSGLMA